MQKNLRHQNGLANLVLLNNQHFCEVSAHPMTQTGDDFPDLFTRLIYRDCT
jgi:hypothetical protein